VHQEGREKKTRRMRITRGLLYLVSVATARQGQRAVRSKTFSIFLLLLILLLLRDVPCNMTVEFAHFLAAAAAAVTSTTGNYRVDVWVCVYIYIYIYK